MIKKTMRILIIFVCLVSMAAAAPVISNVHYDISGSNATINWNTDVTSTTRLTYCPGFTTTWTGTTEVTNLTTSHTVTLSGSFANYVYLFKPVSRDSVGATTIGTQRSTHVIITPGIMFNGWDTSKAIIKFTTEDTSTQLSSSYVEYGPTTAYGTNTAVATSKGHAFALTGLTVGSTINYRIRSSMPYGDVIGQNYSAVVPSNSPNIDPSQVLVLKNITSASSIAIADYYALKRNIPSTNVVNLSIPGSVSLGSAANYQTYVRDPVKAALDANGGALKNTVRFIVVTKGIQYAAAGGAIDLFLYDPYEVLSGGNPYYRKNYRFSSPVVSGSNTMYLVTCIDGSTDEICKGLIDKAIYAEKYAKPGYGTGYWDAQSGTDPKNGYYPPDKAFRTSDAICKAAGYDSVLDNNDERFGTPPAPTHCPNALFYQGWYCGLYEDVYDWKVGAVAWHLESSTASGLQNTGTTNQHWVCGFLNSGVTATLGAVNEPYVSGFAEGDYFSQAFMQGYSFGEACFMSTTWMQWMMCFVGDPIYRLSNNPQTDTTPPAVTNVSAAGVTGYTDTQEKISWETDDPCDSQVEYGLTASYGSLTTLDKWMGCRHNVIITGLNAATTYHYRIKTTDPAGNLTITGDSTFTTTGAVPPAAPVGLSATGTDRAVNLKWTLGTATDLAGYNVYRNTVSGAAGRVLAATLGKVNSYQDSGLNNGTKYYYVITAYDSLSESTVSAEVNATPASLAAPSNVAATPGDGLVNLSWDPVVDVITGGYNIYRSTVSGSYGTVLASKYNGITYFRDTTAVNGTTYYYVVRTIGSTESANSTEVSAVPQVGLGTPELIATAVYQKGSSPSTVYDGVISTGMGNSWTTSNYDSGSWNIRFSGSSAYEDLIYFNLGDTSSWSQVVSAVLSLYAPTVTTADTISARQMTDPDSLGTGFASGWAPANPYNTMEGATKVYRRQGISIDNAVKWQNTDTSTSTNNLENACLPAETGGAVAYSSASTWYNHTVSAAVESFRAHTAPNQGWLVSSTGTANLSINSEKNGTVNLRPKLTVRYKVLNPAAPVISNVAVSSYTKTTGVITWKTDVPCKSKIEYSADLSYGSSTVEDPSLVTEHSQTINGLTEGTSYHFRIKAEDAGAQITYSPDNVLKTKPGAQNNKVVFMFILNLGYNQDQNNEIYQMNLDGSGRIRLTDNNSVERNPVWSPDGTQIVCIQAPTPFSPFYLMLMDADGRNQRRVNTMPGNCWDASFSKDGNSIYFVNDNYSGTTAIYRINTDGTNLIKISTGESDATLKKPVCSPDGTKIMYVSGTTGNQEIYVMNADGSNPINITNAPGNDNQPCWSPDGSQVAFVSDRNGNYQVYKMNSNGSAQTKLTNNVNATLESAVTWSADGTKIVHEYESNVFGTHYVYSMNPDGSGAFKLSNTAYNDAEPNLPMPAAGADVTPPVISSVTAGSITQTGAVITWATNENADTQMEYGITSGYGSAAPLDSSLVTTHTVTIAGLSSGTLYHYKVRSKDVSGNLAASVDYTFTTSAGGPAVTNVTPATGNNSAVTTITVAGSGFYGGTATSTVTAVALDNGGTIITVTGYSVLSDSVIQDGLVPSGKPAGTYDVRVTTLFGTNVTSAVKFVITTSVPVPTVTNVTANTGSNMNATTITITGAGFKGGTSTSAVASVKLSDPASTLIAISGAVIDDTTISGAIVPSGAAVGSYDVRVTTPGGSNTTSAVKFGVTTPLPVVSTIVTSTGSNISATTVAVTGSGFYGGVGSSTVTGISLGSTAIATYTVNSNSSITGLIIPMGIAAGSYDLKVTASGGTNSTSAVKFTVTTPVPTVTNIVTNTAGNLSATTVAITGTGFYGGLGSSTVSGVLLGTTPITIYTVTSTTAITGMVIPSGVPVGSYDLKVTAGGGANTTSAVKFVVTTPAPTVTNIVTNTAANLSATTVVVSGTGFFGGLGSSTISGVLLGTTPITTYTVTSTTVITGMVIPAGISVGSYDLKITAAGGANATSAVKFAVTTPTPAITSLSVNNINYNQATTITVTGTGFFGGLSSSDISAVKLYTSPVTNIAGYSVVNDTSIANVVIPAGIFAGTFSLKVTTTGGGESTGSNFTVNSLTPVVTSITPNTGYKHLNNTVALIGSNFFGSLGTNSVTAVKMTGPSTVTITSYSVVSDTSIGNAIIPSGILAGTYDLLVTSNGKTNGTSIGKYEATTNTTAPKLVTIVASRNEIDILYNSDMNASMSVNSANFTVRANGGAISLIGAVFSYSDRITKISSLPNLTTNVTVRVRNVEDLSSTAIIDDGTNELVGALDLTAPTGTNQINGGNVITGTTTVTLTLSASDAGSGMSMGSAEMRFSNDNSIWSVPESYRITKVWSLSAGDGTKTVYARFKDASGNWSSANITDTITLDTTAPTGSISINSGASYTSNTTVTLTLSAADMNGLAQMQFSNDGVSYGAAEAYGTSKVWTITAGDGTKTVYVKYKDSVDNWTSANITDTIVLDTTGPAGTVVINGGQVSTMNTTVTLSLSGVDTGSGVVSMQMSNDNITYGAAEAYSVNKVWVMPAGEGVKTVYVKYIDALGNNSAAISDTISLCLVQYLKVETIPDKVIRGDMVVIKVTACLTDGSMSTNYYNSVVYNNSDFRGTALGSYTFTGTGTRNVSNNNVFNTIGRQTITVVDSVISSISGSASVKVFDAKLVNAGTGGMFTSADGTSMYIPAGALNADAYLGFSVTDSPLGIGSDYKIKDTVNPVCRDYGELFMAPRELKDFTFKKAVTVSIPYETADISGIDEQSLRIFYFDKVSGKYELIPGAQTAGGGKVTASVMKFTTYRILGTYLAANLDNVIGYPSPFNLSTAVSGKFKVRNLPPDCVMTVFNIAGEKVRELSEANQTVSNAGWIEWDGKNELGETVGQGMYLYIIKTADGQKKTGKIGLVK